MIRSATSDDIGLIEDTYNEHFKYEMEHVAFTIFKKGIYPARKDAEKAVSAETLYVSHPNIFRRAISCAVVELQAPCSILLASSKTKRNTLS